MSLVSLPARTTPFNLAGLQFASPPYLLRGAPQPAIFHYQSICPGFPSSRSVCLLACVPSPTSTCSHLPLWSTSVSVLVSGCLSLDTKYRHRLQLSTYNSRLLDDTALGASVLWQQTFLERLDPRPRLTHEPSAGPSQHASLDHGGSGHFQGFFLTGILRIIPYSGRLQSVSLVSSLHPANWKLRQFSAIRLVHDLLSRLPPFLEFSVARPAGMRCGG